MTKRAFNYQSTTSVEQFLSPDTNFTTEETQSLYEDWGFPIDDDIESFIDIDEDISIEEDEEDIDEDYSSYNNSYYSGSSYEPREKSDKKPLIGIFSRIKRWNDFNVSKDIMALSHYISQGYIMNKHQEKRYNKLWMNCLLDEQLYNIEKLMAVNKNLSIGVKESTMLLFNVSFLSKEFYALAASEESVDSILHNIFYVTPEKKACCTLIGQSVINCINEPDFINHTASLWAKNLGSDMGEHLSSRMLITYKIMRKRWDFVDSPNDALELNIESNIGILAKKYDSDELRELLQLVSKDFTIIIDHKYTAPNHINNKQIPKTEDIKIEEVKNIVPGESQELLDKIYKLHHNIKTCNVKLEVEQEHRVQNIMIEYLPQVMDHYFSVNPEYRDNLKDHNNLTSNELLLHTLDNILGTMKEIDKEINLEKIKKLSVAKHYTASFKR